MVAACTAGTGRLHSWVKYSWSDLQLQKPRIFCPTKITLCLRLFLVKVGCNNSWVLISCLIETHPEALEDAVCNIVCELTVRVPRKFHIQRMEIGERPVAVASEIEKS